MAGTGSSQRPSYHFLPGQGGTGPAWSHLAILVVTGSFRWGLTPCLSLSLSLARCIFLFRCSFSLHLCKSLSMCISFFTYQRTVRPLCVPTLTCLPTCFRTFATALASLLHVDMSKCTYMQEHAHQHIYPRSLQAKPASMQVDIHAPPSASACADTAYTCMHLFFVSAQTCAPDYMHVGLDLMVVA